MHGKFGEHEGSAFVSPRGGGARKSRRHNKHGGGGGSSDDIGCYSGDPNNVVLPWANGEALPTRLPVVPANDTFTSWAPRPLRKCAIVIDRHVHKNGGSTVRDLFLEHERLGMALYQGYTQMYWNRDFRVIKAAADAAQERGAASPEHVILIEAHFGWVEMAQQVLPSLHALERQYAKAGADCPIVKMTRVREPLEYYLSFYRWGVAFRQKADPANFGRNFLEWVERVPDLQSVTMMQSMAAMAAEYHVHQFKMHYSRSHMVGKTEEIAWERLSDFLDSFTIVGTMKRFDESLLMLHDLVGLPILLYKRNRPGQKGGFKGNNNDVCPDMEVCRAAVRKHAPRDHKMYDRYNERFEKQLAQLGEGFARRVQAYKQAITEIQPVWKKVPRKQFICRYHPETSASVPILRKRNIRCPVVDGGAELCQNVYAHRLFECPWQFVANSSLSDPLGCWRPTTGFK